MTLDPKRIPLGEYYTWGKSPRLNSPEGYIAYLKKQPRFRGCLLEGLPQYAVIIYDAHVTELLTRLGYDVTEYTTLQTGTSTPNVLYHVSPKNQYPAFLINRGLPGAGGVTTQAAELVALGARYIIHVGTCGLVSEDIEAGAILLSEGSIRDCAAVMLANESTDELALISKPSKELASALKDALTASGWSFRLGLGYSIPIFYLQPSGLIEALVNNTIWSSETPQISYFEMEQAAFFETCSLMGVHAASLVVGSDRYAIHDGELIHSFEADFDQDEAELAQVRSCLSVFKHIDLEAYTLT